MEEQKDLCGICKIFKVEYIENGNYDDDFNSIKNGEIEPTIIVGTLTQCTNPVNGRIFIIDDDGCINIIPIMRIVSMIPVKNTLNEVVKDEEI